MLLQYTFFGASQQGFSRARDVEHLFPNVLDSCRRGIGQQFYIGGSLYCQILWFFMSLISVSGLI